MRSLSVAAVLAATLALAACNAEPGTQAPQQEEGNPTGLAVANARLILPAVAGNPAAVYFDLTNAGTRSVAVRAADIADAQRAELHDMMEFGGKMTMSEMGPLGIPQGQTVKFAPGGKHVMAFELSPELKAGGTTEMTLTIAGGDKASFPVRIEAANAAR